MTFREFLPAFIKVPDERTRRLVPLVLHPTQQRFADAIDQRDPETGLRHYATFVLSMIKKAGKSTLLGALAVWGLVADDLAGADREVILVASTLAQSQDISFLAAVRMIQRNPWLRARCKVTQCEITFTESVVDPATGGRYQQTHVIRAVPRSTEGLHGFSPSVLIADESWTMSDYDLLEALAPSPARRSPITVLASYAGLASQQHAGIPWYDVMQRAKAGTDPTLFLAHLAGPDAWREVPWITPRWIAQMHATYEACPSKYVRLVENRVAASEHGLITPEELQDAIDATLTEPLTGAPGVRYILAGDLGLTNDFSALVLLHVARGHAIVDLTRVWKGTRQHPVDLQEVEREIIHLAADFPMDAIVLDPWQAALMVQRLLDRGLPVRAEAITATRMDQAITILKQAFSRRQITVPGSGSGVLLVEQLESAETVESRARGLIKFAPSGRGPSAREHDDLLCALMFALEALPRDVLGRRALPAQSSCLRHANNLRADCLVWGGAIVPYDPICGECASWKAIRSAWLSESPTTSIREYYHVGMWTANELVTTQRERAVWSRVADVEGP